MLKFIWNNKKGNIRNILLFLSLVSVLFLFGCKDKEDTINETVNVNETSESILYMEETEESMVENTSSEELTVTSEETVVLEETETEETLPFVLPDPICMDEVITDSISYCVIDESETVWLSKNALTRMHPASTTKVLTALVTLEHCSLSDMVTVSERAVNDVDVMSSGCEPPYKPGEVVSVKDLLYALILPSTNTAGNILAEHVSGSIEGFTDLMNQKCKDLGLENSHFSNPHGLDSEDHYSCAYDLSVIMREACKNADLVQIMRVPDYTTDETNLTKPRYMVAGHDIISGYIPCEGVYAGKPGRTVLANSTLVTAVERYGKKFFIATMNSDDRQAVADTINLIDKTYRVYDPAAPNTGAPLQHDIQVIGEDETGITIRIIMDGSYTNVWTYHWFDPWGPPAAIRQDYEPNHEIIAHLPMSEKGNYVLQIFAKNGEQKEIGRGLNLLFTGQMKEAGVINGYNGANYYISKDGTLDVFAVEFEDYSMYTDGDGKLLYNSFSDDKLFYCDENGHVITGFKAIDGNMYYFQSDGTMIRSSSIMINNEWHTFDENGVMLN